MNTIVFASRKGGSGKSTLTAHLAALANQPSRPCLLVDADPQCSLTLWHRLRGADQPALKSGLRGIVDTIKAAKRDGYAFAFVDTPPTMSSAVTEAIRAATLVVIPARPTIFDLTAVKETIDVARALRKPYLVVLNAAPAKRDDAESPIVAKAREGLAGFNAPVWAGQITSRTSFYLALAAGQGAREFDADSLAAAEIARLWSTIDKSVKAIHGAYENARGLQRAA